MDRLIATNSVAIGGADIAPSSGTPQYATSGNPAGAIPATVFPAYQYNALQEEIIAVIAGGGITPDRTNNAQLLAAIENLIAAASGSAFTTGDVKPTWKSAADTGWIMMNDGTIGSASSGAGYANANAAALYELWWANVSNTNAPVTGGRGGSGAADFAANKPMRMPLALGRALAFAGAGSGLTSFNLGDTTGENTHTLTTTEMPSHNHTTNESPHAHGISYSGNNGYSGGGNPFPSSGGFGGPSTGSASTGLSINSAGSGGAHNNMQPSSFLNVMVKL
jgi:microcystin-dependent protein